MKAKLMKVFKPWLRSLVVLFLVALVVFSHASEALARRGGGRIGGGSFRMPTRTAPAPSRSYGGGGYYGGGSSFFFLPFFIGGGGGSIFSLLVLLAIAGVVMQAFRGNSGEGITGIDSKVTLAKLQVGLLSSARDLQRDLSRLALEADTGSTDGLALILQETTVSLMRHPEYWVYVSSAKETTKFELAEQRFNSLAMSERSKLSTEVLSNVNKRIQQASALGVLPSSGDISIEDPSEYIVVTLLVAEAGDSLSKLPEIRSANDLKTALSAIGAVPKDRVLAVEVLWEPQSDKYTLSADEVLTVYPSLLRI